MNTIDIPISLSADYAPKPWRLGNVEVVPTGGSIPAKLGPVTSIAGRNQATLSISRKFSPCTLKVNLSCDDMPLPRPVQVNV
jgi:hypothetical protein